ncbi:Uncharacterized protein HZ326_22997, partial [Fusarium oxysporum f. sp. albedinis]
MAHPTSNPQAFLHERQPRSLNRESLGWGQPRAPSRCRKQYRERRCRANWLPKVGCRHQTGANAYEN